MLPRAISLRPGEPGDAVAIAALSVQVFLDTYATEGVRSDLAREAFSEYSEQAFRARLAEGSRRFVLAEAQGALIGFAELDCLREAPIADFSGWELVRLYVQPQAQRLGIGAALLERSEKIALDAGARGLWLSVWERNARALAFYAAKGYADVGAGTHAFGGREYGNRVVTKQLFDAWFYVHAGRRCD